LPGGAGRFVLETAVRFVKKGYEVKVISIRHNSSICAAAMNEGVQFLEIGGPLCSQLSFWLSFPLSFIKIAKILLGEGRFILFPQVFPANWWGFIFKFFYPKTPTVWMCQEPSAFIHSKAWIDSIPSRLMKFCVKTLNPLLKLIDVFLARKADFVFTNSLYGKGFAKKVYSFGDDKIAHVYLGHAFGHMPGKNESMTRTRQVITICRLTKFKNVDLVIRAMAQLRSKGYENLSFKIVGKGEEEENLKELAEELNLADHVCFCGGISDEALERELLTSKAFVLASAEEPFGLATVEALACGVPAIVCGQAGSAEIVEDEKSGFYVRPYNVEDIAEKIGLLTGDTSLFEKMSKNALLRAAAFDWDKTVDKLIGVMAQTVIRMNAV